MKSGATSQPRHGTVFSPRFRPLPAVRPPPDQRRFHRHHRGHRLPIALRPVGGPVAPHELIKRCEHRRNHASGEQMDPGGGSAGGRMAGISCASGGRVRGASEETDLGVVGHCNGREIQVFRHLVHTVCPVRPLFTSAWGPRNARTASVFHPVLGRHVCVGVFHVRHAQSPAIRSQTLFRNFRRKMLMHHIGCMGKPVNKAIRRPPGFRIDEKVCFSLVIT